MSCCGTSNRTLVAFIFLSLMHMDGRGGEVDASPTGYMEEGTLPRKDILMGAMIIKTNHHFLILECQFM